MTDSSTHDFSESLTDEEVLAALRNLLLNSEQLADSSNQDVTEDAAASQVLDPEAEVLATLRYLLLDSDNQNVSNQADNRHPLDPEEALAELRALLFNQEQTQLNQLQQRLNDPKLYAADLSRVLPEAIMLRSLEDQQLVKALIPTLEEAIKTSVRKDFKILANALFPVIGPAIRKAIASALSTMIQSLNQTLNHSFSPQSFKWRLEARQTGKTFAEVVMLRTLIYRVEQVFLIHKHTGLLLQHAVARGLTVQDGDLVSAMLTAIKDFVQDSFNVQKGDSLETLQFGELTIWIEEGPQAILAGVIRGNAPHELRSVFQDALESIHLQLGSALESFTGDTLPFETSKPYLEDCLLVQFEHKEDKEHKKNKKPKNQQLILKIVSGVVLLAVGPWLFFQFRDNQRWASYLEKLNTERGIVVVAADKRNGKFFISGLRDPLAADPKVIMNTTNLSPDQVTSRWESYLSAEPKFVETRARQILQPPKTVSLKVNKNGILYATGSASEQWITQAKKLVQVIPGITKFQFQKSLINTDIRELELSKQQIEKQVILFEAGTQLASGQDKTIQNLVKQIQQIDNSAQLVNKNIQIWIIGHTDNEGTAATNIKLSQARAQKVLSALVANKLKPSDFTTVGVRSKESLGNSSTIEAQNLNRNVTFKIFLTDTSFRTSTNR